MEVNFAKEEDFESAYEKIINTLHKVSYNVVGDPGAAEDICHDAFIKAHEKSLCFASVDEAKFYLIRMVKNASINFVRRKACEKKAYEKLFRERKENVPGGEEETIKREAASFLRAALEKLPPSLKSAIILKEWTELNYKEIARILAISEGNVKIRVFRAHQKLRKILGGKDGYMS